MSSRPLFLDLYLDCLTASGVSSPESHRAHHPETVGLTQLESLAVVNPQGSSFRIFGVLSVIGGLKAPSSTCCRVGSGSSFYK